MSAQSSGEAGCFGVSYLSIAWISRTRSSSNSSYLVSSSSALNSDGSKNLRQRSEMRIILHDVEEFTNIVLEGCSGEDNPLPNLERTQFFEKLTLIILQRLSLIHNQTLPRILSQERDVCPCGAVPCNHHVCLEIQHCFRSAQFVCFLPELIRSGLGAVQQGHGPRRCRGGLRRGATGPTF